MLSLPINVIISLVKDHQLLLTNDEINVLMIDHTLKKTLHLPKVIEISLVFLHEDLVCVYHVHLLSCFCFNGYERNRGSNSGLPLASSDNMNLLRVPI